MVKLIIAILIVAVAECLVLKRGWFKSEIQRNENFDPPSEQQLKWDLRHMREDIYMLVTICRIQMWAILIFIVYKW